MKRALLCLTLLLTACAPKVYDDPIPIMSDTARDPDERLNAARQAEQQFPNDPRRVKALGQLVWDRGHPAELRRYAIDQLVTLDEARFRRELAGRIVLIQNRETLQYIYDLAAARQWTDMTPVIVKRWALREWGTPDRDRIESAAILKLNPGKTAEQVVFEVFAADADQLPSDQRGAAWELLNRLAERERVMTLLRGAADKSVLIIDLKAAVNELAVLPVNREELTRLFFLRDDKRKATWNAWRDQVTKLNDEHKRGLELRHLPVLACVAPARLGQNRSSLLAALRHRLAGREHVVLSPTFDGAAKEHPQMLGEWADRLAWADLLTIMVLMDALEDRKVASDLFAQADRDLADQTTEFGGLITTAAASTAEPTRAGYVAQLVPPRARKHDRAYLSPPELVDAVYTGLAHYHFHCQEQRNREFAGPGRGDAEFADRLRFNGLVFTFIDRERLNMDYYQHGGVVIDLGMLGR